MASLHMRHFLQRLAHTLQATIWLHGWNSMSRLLSEQTMHSSRISCWFFITAILVSCCLVSSLDGLIRFFVMLPALVSSLEIFSWYFFIKILLILESVHMSIGVWCFLFLMLRLAPLFSRIHAKFKIAALSTTGSVSLVVLVWKNKEYVYLFIN